MRIHNIHKPGYDKLIIETVRGIHPDRKSPKQNILAVLHRFGDLVERCIDDPHFNETSRDDAKLWLAGMIYAVECSENARIPRGDQIC